MTTCIRLFAGLDNRQQARERFLVLDEQGPVGCYSCEFAMQEAHPGTRVAMKITVSVHELETIGRREYVIAAFEEAFA